MKKHFLMAMTLMAGICVGCSDSDDFDPADYELNQDAQDVACGMNIIILEGKKDIDKGIEIGIKGEVEARNTNKLIAYDCVHKDGKSYLMPQVDMSEHAFALTDQVTIHVPHNEKLDKKITVVFRKEPKLMSSHTYSGVSEKVGNRLVDVLGRGFDIIQELGMTRSNVLNKELLLEVDEAMKGDILSFNSNQQPQESTYKEGYDFNSVSRAWSNSTGLNVKFPLKGLILNVGISVEVSKSKYKESSNEYVMATQKATKAEGYIKEDALAAYAEQNGLGDFYWASVMSQTLNDVLNNPGSAAYKRYAETEEGTMQLLQAYGGWFYTACQLGGNYNYIMTKTSELDQESFKWGVAVDLSLKKKVDEECHLLGEYLNNKAKSQIAEFHEKFERQGEDLHKSMNIESETFSNGGAYTTTSSGARVWDITNEPDNWVPIAYGTSSDVADVEKGLTNKHFHSLYDLCADTTSVRAKAIKKALTADANGCIPYISYLNGYINSTESRMVLADVILVEKTGGSQSVGVPAKGDDEPFWDVTPGDGKLRKYYPLVVNTNQDFFKAYGYQPQLNQFYFHGESTTNNKSRHYVFYALDWNAPGVGITNIRLGRDNDLAPGECVRGINTDKNLKHWGVNGKQYIIVKWAADNTPVDKKITGFGLKYTDWDTANGNYIGLVFASTGGTEWDKSDHFERGSEYEKYFLKYWDPKENYHRCEKDPGAQNSFIDLETKPRKHTMHMCWTTKPIERDMSGISNDKKSLAVDDIGKKCPICMPYKWGIDKLTGMTWDSVVNWPAEEEE